MTDTNAYKKFIVESIRQNYRRNMRQVDESAILEHADSWWKDCKDFAVYPMSSWEQCFTMAERRKSGIVRCPDFVAELEAHQVPPQRGKLNRNSMPASKEFRDTIMRIAGCLYRLQKPPDLSDRFVSEFRANKRHMEQVTLDFWETIYPNL